MHKKEKGAIVVEASLALPIYMFLIVTILSFINICYVQTKVQIALNTSAKQMSEYMHMYYASGANTLLGSGGGTSSEVTEKLSGYMKDILELLGIENEFLDGFVEALGNTSIAGILEDGGATMVAKQIVETELVSSTEETADEFYSRMNMEDERYSATLREDGGSKILAIGVSYDVKVIELFDTNVSFHFYNVAGTQVWDAYKEETASK